MLYLVSKSLQEPAKTVAAIYAAVVAEQLNKAGLIFQIEKRGFRIKAGQINLILKNRIFIRFSRPRIKT